MSYGLYDGDLKLYPRVPFFNLELMKLSTYYKSKRELVSLSPEFKPQMYSHFIVRQDYPSRSPYSTIYKNIEYGGRAFDGETYQSLPEPIEFSRPNIDLYNRIESQLPPSQQVKRQFSVMRRAEHIRLSLDGKNISPQWEKQIRGNSNVHGLIFHDYDLGAVDGSLTFIQDNLNDIIRNMPGRRIGMKFPAQVFTEEKLLQWLTLPNLGNFFFLQYNGILTTNNFYELKQLRRNSTAIPQTTINITGNQEYNAFITTGIIDVFKTMLDLRSEQLYFPLIYDKDFFIDKRWEDITDLICAFNHHIGHWIDSRDYYERVAPYETFFDYIKRLTKEKVLYGSIYPKQKARELFQFVREQNYELFYLFYEYTGEKRL